MRTPWLKDLLLVVACLVTVALWIDFSRIHRFHNSDSLVFVLTSLYRWTPLYWEQDRLGMLFALLATPWSHPLDNLLVQSALNILVCLSSFFLLGYYLLGRTRGIALGALSAIFLMVFTRLDQRHASLILHHEYAAALAFGLAGLVLLDRWARGHSALWIGVSAVLIAIAHWLNPAVAFALGPLVLARGCCFRGLGAYFEDLDAAQLAGSPEPAVPRLAGATSWVERIRPSRGETVGLVLIVLSLGGSMVLSRSAPEQCPYHLIGPSAWLQNMVNAATSLTDSFRHQWFVATAIAAAIGLLTLYWPAGRQAARVSLPLAGGLLFAALVQFAFMTSLNHLQVDYCSRYVIIAVLLWQAALLGFAVVQMGAVLGSTRLSRALPYGLLLAFVVAAMVAHGRPSVATVRKELDHCAGRYTDDILAGNCTHISGDYWHVWSAMFHVNLRLADEGSPRRVWGIAQRSSVTAIFWQQVPWTDVRIAEIVGDETQSQQGRSHYHLPPAAVERQLATIRVLRATAPWDDQHLAGQGTTRK